MKIGKELDPWFGLEKVGSLGAVWTCDKRLVLSLKYWRYVLKTG